MQRNRYQEKHLPAAVVPLHEHETEVIFISFYFLRVKKEGVGFAVPLNEHETEVMVLMVVVVVESGGVVREWWCSGAGALLA